MDLREGLLGFLQVRCFPTRLVGGFCSSSCRFLQPLAARHSSRIPATELGSGVCFPMHMIAGGWPRIIQHTTPLYLGITYIGVVRKQPACNSLSGLAKDKGQRKKSQIPNCRVFFISPSLCRTVSFVVSQILLFVVPRGALTHITYSTRTHCLDGEGGYHPLGTAVKMKHTSDRRPLPSPLEKWKVESEKGGFAIRHRD